MSYEINKDNFLTHELIGLKLVVVKSSHKDFEGIEGRIVDETKNTFKVETEGGVKVVPKKENTFKITSPEGVEVEVSGSKLVVRPFERTKKLWK